MQAAENSGVLLCHLLHLQQLGSLDQGLQLLAGPALLQPLRPQPLLHLADVVPARDTAQSRAQATSRHPQGQEPQLQEHVSFLRSRQLRMVPLMRKMSWRRPGGPCWGPARGGPEWHRKSPGTAAAWAGCGQGLRWSGNGWGGRRRTSPGWAHSPAWQQYRVQKADRNGSQTPLGGASSSQDLLWGSVSQLGTGRLRTPPGELDKASQGLTSLLCPWRMYRAPHGCIPSLPRC